MKKTEQEEKKRIGDVYPRCDQDRRIFNYTVYIPERRSGTDRRKTVEKAA